MFSNWECTVLSDYRYYTVLSDNIFCTVLSDYRYYTVSKQVEGFTARLQELYCQNVLYCQTKGFVLSDYIYCTVRLQVHCTLHYAALHCTKYSTLLYFTVLHCSPYYNDHILLPVHPSCLNYPEDLTDQIYSQVTAYHHLNIVTGTICGEGEEVAWWMEPLGRFPRELNVLPREKFEGPWMDFLKANPRPHPRPDQRPKTHKVPLAPRVFGLWSGQGCVRGFAIRKTWRGPSIFFRGSTLSIQGTSRGLDSTWYLLGFTTDFHSFHLMHQYINVKHENKQTNRFSTGTLGSSMVNVSSSR